MKAWIISRIFLYCRYGLLIAMFALNPASFWEPVSAGEDIYTALNSAAKQKTIHENLPKSPSDLETDILNGPKAPSEVSNDWWSQVQEDIRLSEYNLTWQDQTYLKDVPSAYQAPNRAQGIRTYFTPDGIRVIPRMGTEPTWEWGLVLSSFGYSGAEQPGVDLDLVVEGNRVNYQRGSLMERYINDERGLEQRFTVFTPPENKSGASANMLLLQMDLLGNLHPTLDASASEIEFNSQGGVRVLHYSQLQAYDSRGRNLPANFLLSSEGIDIQVDTKTALFPITIDTLVTSPAWIAESDQASAYFGCSVSTAGDVNGDGYDDVIVGAQLFDNGQTDEGRAFVYHGGALGLNTSPDWSAESDQDHAQFGTSVSGAGDVNNDTYADVIIGAPQYDNPSNNEGRAYVYHGSSNGLSTSPDWTMESDQEGAYFGTSVASAGYVNDDDFADVIIGAPGFNSKDGENPNEGHAFVYHGSSSGLSSSENWVAEGNQTSAYLGESVNGVGDVNGDGYDDVIVGAYLYDSRGIMDAGMANVFYGGSSGLNISPNWTEYGSQIDDWYGYSVGTGGDVNGDGYDDIIIGALEYDIGEDLSEGRVEVFYGSSSGLPSSPDWTVQDDQTFTSFGYSVASAGDTDADGYDDVIIGASAYDNGETNEGRAFLYRGSAMGLTTSPDWTSEGNQENAKFGSSVRTAGDVNGDGCADLIVGAPGYDNGEINEGRAFVFSGCSSDLLPSSDWTADGDQADALFGYSVASAGDVNSDGYADVIIGAPWYDNGQQEEGRAFVYHGGSGGLNLGPNWTAESNQEEAKFSHSVGSAGDVNGDGYADVIVGANSYDDGEFQEGKAYVYHGSSSGLNPSPNWTDEGDLDFAVFGYSVSSAGDVNGDGYTDVIIGSTEYSNGEICEGRASVYYGGPAGLSSNPAWTAESDQEDAYFGYSVSSAGDVNGDGFADVIVGAPYFETSSTQSNEGRVFVYSGGSTGLSTSPDWTAAGNQEGVHLGISVASAGDVNGDGYADVVLGGPGFSNGQENEGRALVYLGSSTGLLGSTGWTAESNQENAKFGTAVSSAGDVNGDGFADVIVGAIYNTGQAFLYYGGSTGLSVSPGWTVMGEQSQSYFGHSVSSAGDVNGDGFADIIVGAYEFTNDQEKEGRVYVYHGGSSGLSTSPTWSAESDQSVSHFGASVGSAGDVNGDGFTDVIVGAYAYDNGEADEGMVFVYYGNSLGINNNPDWMAEGNQIEAYFGAPVGTAGDVNGDGYADVIVGAVAYDNGQDNEGVAVVYHGSPTGLSADPDWMGESNRENILYGSAVGTAGDVNGDGYADVIVGAPYFENGETGEGRAFVYHGGLAGLSTSPDWTAESNQEAAYFGSSVSSAGDVNGDGYADVIVGATLYDGGVSDEGSAFVYFGGSSGLGTSPDWTAKSNQLQSYFGVSVGSAGDVNGDGYSDVLVGAHKYDNLDGVEGAVFAWYGGTSGLGLNGTPVNADWKAESDQDNVGFGSTVSGAGDVNGDGYADVLVGAYWYENEETKEGRVQLYQGSDSGLSESPVWSAEGNQDNAWFGKSLGSAGDVNGDGYADVIIGSEWFTNDQVNEGHAYIYYGNSPGRLVIARQEKSNQALIQPWGFSDSTDSFQVSMQASDPMGRGRVKLQVQVCPASVDFSSSDCQTHTSAEWMDVTTADNGILITESISGLDANQLYRWRARVLYAPQTVTEPGITPPPNPAHGPWRRFQGQSNEADLRIISYPLPGITQLDPAYALQGGAGFTLAVSGSNFVNAASTVLWDGVDCTTTVISSTMLQAQISVEQLASPGTVDVTVFNSSPGGGLSNPLPFKVYGTLPDSGQIPLFLPLVQR